MKKNSKGGHILYLMVHVPLVIFWKIGITGNSPHARAKGIDRAMFGFPVPVFFVVIPGGAYRVEQWLHGMLSGLSVRFYRGDGASEWMLFPAAPIAIAVMSCIWGIYFFVFLGISKYLLHL